ncbi:MAG: tetratricopeptide repeat protein [Chitinophagaceae bacterium]
MTTKVEQLYLEAEADIRNTNYHEAFEKYETILYEEPGFAPAHNSMGWIYKTQFDNYAKAENHFKAAIQADPLYPHPYFHLSTIYFDLDKFDALKSHLEKCLNVTTVEKAWIYYRFGMIEETLANYNEAILLYKKAITNSFNNEKIADYKADIERCNTKIEIGKISE